MGGLISWLVWGLFIGAIARLLVPGRQPIGCLWTAVLGVAGSLAGGLIATQLLNIGDTDNFDFGSFAIAVLTSTVLLAIAERVNRAMPDRRPPRDPLDRYR